MNGISIMRGEPMNHELLLLYPDFIIIANSNFKYADRF